MAKKEPAFSFVIDELLDSPVGPFILVRPMFGSHSVYVNERLVFILRRKDEDRTRRDNGVWVASLPEHNSALKKDFPTLRLIEIFKGEAFAGWLNLPEDEEGFEEAALALCALIVQGDPRVGKDPKPRAKPRTKSRPKPQSQKRKKVAKKTAKKKAIKKVAAPAKKAKR